MNRTTLLALRNVMAKNAGTSQGVRKSWLKRHRGPRYPGGSTGNDRYYWDLLSKQGVHYGEHVTKDPSGVGYQHQGAKYLSPFDIYTRRPVNPAKRYRVESDISGQHSVRDTHTGKHVPGHFPTAEHAYEHAHDLNLKAKNCSAANADSMSGISASPCVGTYARGSRTTVATNSGTSAGVIKSWLKRHHERR
jgi:hypothetical protein